MDESAIEAIAERSAQKALINMFEIFGADITTPAGRKMIQEDWSWVRDTRVGTKAIRNTTIGALIVSAASGLAYAIWKGLSVMASLASKS